MFDRAGGLRLHHKREVRFAKRTSKRARNRLQVDVATGQRGEKSNDGLPAKRLKLNAPKNCLQHIKNRLRTHQGLVCLLCCRSRSARENFIYFVRRCSSLLDMIRQRQDWDVLLSVRHFASADALVRGLPLLAFGTTTRAGVAAEAAGERLTILVRLAAFVDIKLFMRRWIECLSELIRCLSIV